MIILPYDLNREVNKKIDEIMLEMIFHCKEKIYEKEYDTAKEILDNLLYWRDIRGDVTDCSKNYIESDKQIDNLVMEIINYNIGLEND